MDRSAYLSMASNETSHWWFAGRRAILDSLIRRVVPQEATLRVLEIGCGSGGNLALLRQFGSVEAIETDPEARRLAGTRSGLSIAAGSLPADLPVPDERYDLVALLDVLEHVEEDVASLRAIGRKLSAEGRLLVTVPAMPWLWSAHDEAHHHKRRYTRTSLEAALGKAGLEIERIGAFNTLLFPLAVAVRMLKAGLGRDSADDAMPARPLNRVLKAIFASERHVVGRMRLPVGLSLFAVVRRGTNPGPLAKAA